MAAISPWVLDAFLDVYEEQQAVASYNFYQLILKDPDAEPLHGQMFKRQALRYFSHLKENTQFSIQSLNDFITSIGIYPGPSRHSSFTSFTVAQLLQDAVIHGKPIHLLPTNPHFLVVDSIFYDPG